MPVTFGQNEKLSQTRKDLPIIDAQPDKSLASDSFKARQEPERYLDVSIKHTPLPFYPQLDSFLEGHASSINSVLTDQQQRECLPHVRGTNGEATYPKVGFRSVHEECLAAPLHGFKRPYEPSRAGLREAQPPLGATANLQEAHIASVLAEEEHGYRRPDPENARIISRALPAGGSRLYGRNQGLARQLNPHHLRKPRMGLPLSRPALPGTDYSGYYINNGKIPEQRRLPEQ